MQIKTEIMAQFKILKIGSVAASLEILLDLSTNV
jgi:hypothetical protein